METAPLTPEQHKREIEIELDYLIWRKYFERENEKELSRRIFTECCGPYTSRFFVNRWHPDKPVQRVSVRGYPPDPIRRRIIAALDRAIPPGRVPEPVLMGGG